MKINTTVLGDIMLAHNVQEKRLFDRVFYDRTHPEPGVYVLQKLPEHGGPPDAAGPSPDRRPVGK